MALMRAVVHFTINAQTGQCVYDYWREGADFYSVLDVANFLENFKTDLVLTEVANLLSDYCTIHKVTARVIHQPSLTVSQVLNQPGLRDCVAGQELPSFLAFGIQKWVGESQFPLTGDPYLSDKPIVSGFQFFPGVQDQDIANGVYAPTVGLTALMDAYISAMQDPVEGSMGVATVEWQPYVYGGILYAPGVEPPEVVRPELVAPLIGATVVGISPLRSRKT